MVQKRKNEVDLRTLEDSDPRYWEEILRREGLTVSAGRSRHLIYVESIEQMDQQEGDE